jgi:hypothetical protein
MHDMLILNFIKKLFFFAFQFQVVLMDEFDVLQIVGEGWFGKILLVGI